MDAEDLALAQGEMGEVMKRAAFLLAILCVVGMTAMCGAQTGTNNRLDGYVFDSKTEAVMAPQSTPPSTPPGWISLQEIEQVMEDASDCWDRQSAIIVTGTQATVVISPPCREEKDRLRSMARMIKDINKGGK